VGGWSTSNMLLIPVAVIATTVYIFSLDYHFWDPPDPSYSIILIAVLVLAPFFAIAAFGIRFLGKHPQSENDNLAFLTFGYFWTIGTIVFIVLIQDCMETESFYPRGKASNTMFGVLGKESLRIVCGIPSLLTYPAFYLVSITCAASVFPFLIGLYAIVAAPPPEVKSADKHRKAKRSDRVLLKEFNAALKKGALDDDEIFGLLNEMSPLQRYFQTIKYRVHAHKYRKIVELQAEQVKKAKYRNTAGMNAADLERERAAAEDAGTYTKTESTDTDEDEEDLKNTCPECNGSGELNLQGENFTTIVRCENCWGYGDMEIYERVRKEHEEWLNADERSNTCKMCDGDREIEVTINDISHKVPCPECQVNDER